jgi:hypothetical protein
VFLAVLAIGQADYPLGKIECLASSEGFECVEISFHYYSPDMF